jgi:hypothetical protein
MGIGLSSNDLNSIFTNTYLEQLSKNNGKEVDVNSSEFANNLAFKSMLKMMVSSMNGSEGGSSTGDSTSSMMGDLIMSAFDNANNSKGTDSFNMFGALNSNLKNYNLLSKYNLGVGQAGLTGLMNGLGKVSAKYESQGDCGTISNTSGDYGGKSYGIWQFSANTGSLNSFINSLKNGYGDFYSRLIQAKANDGGNYGSNFDREWTNIAKQNGTKFTEAQRQYVKTNFYDLAASMIQSNSGVNINSKSEALKEALWSTAVQHGPSGAANIFSKLNLNASDKSIINALYNERQNVDKYFSGSSQDVRQSVYNRFNKEKLDVLSLL